MYSTERDYLPNTYFQRLVFCLNAFWPQFLKTGAFGKLHLYDFPGLLRSSTVLHITAAGRLPRAVQPPSQASSPPRLKGSTLSSYLVFRLASTVPEPQPSTPQFRGVAASPRPHTPRAPRGRGPAEEPGGAHGRTPPRACSVRRAALGRGEGCSAAASGVCSRVGAAAPPSRPRLSAGALPLPEAPAAPARPDLAPCPAKMAAVRRARSYCRCLVRFSDRELC